MATKDARRIKSGALLGERNPIKTSPPLEIPEGGGAINIDYCNMFAEIAWPTQMEAYGVLRILHRTMHIKSNSVSLYFVESEHPEIKKLEELQHLTQSRLDRLETAALDDTTSGDGVTWQKAIRYQSHNIAGARAAELHESWLEASFSETGDSILKKYAGAMALQAIKITQDI